MTSSTGKMVTRCGQIMREVCAGLSAELREFNRDDDHVRLLVRYPPKLPVSTLVNRLKGVSAHYLRDEFTGRVNPHLTKGHLWSSAYLAASCAAAPPAIIREYIEQHKRPT